MPKEQFDHKLPGLELCSQAPQSNFVGVRGHAEGQLIAKILGEFLLETKSGLIVELVLALSKAESCSQFFLWKPLHPDEQPALAIRAARPLVNTSVDLFPAAKIEIPDTKIGAHGDKKCLLQCGEQICFDVVEDSRHGCSLARESALSGDCLQGQPVPKKSGTCLLTSHYGHWYALGRTLWARPSRGVLSSAVFQVKLPVS